MPVTADSTSNASDAAMLANAVQYLNNSPSAMYALTQNFTITMNHTDNDMVYGATLGSTNIFWDPTAAHVVVDANNVQGVQSPAIALIHEIAHSLFGANEAQATAFETQIANELGEPTRATYGQVIGTIVTQNSTEHTHQGQWTEREPGGGTTTGGMYNGSTNGAAQTLGGTGGGYSAPGSSGYTYGGDGGIYGGGVDDGGGGSVPCPHCYIMQNGVPVPPTALDPHNEHLVGLAQFAV